MSWEAAIKTSFPDALPSPEVTAHYLDVLQDEYSVDPDTVLMCTSTCSDEICRGFTDFSKRFVSDGPFFAGGLAGMPWTGLTGFTVFARHVPDDGTAFILYGPHVGISDDGEWGKVTRAGKADLGSSCDALMIALDRLRDDDYTPVGKDIDHQQVTLERTIMPFKARILAAANPVLAITNVTYNLIHASVNAIVEGVKDEFQCARIVLLGGVLINTGPDKDDYVEVRHFKVIELGPGEREEESDDGSEAFLDMLGDEAGEDEDEFGAFLDTPDDEESDDEGSEDEFGAFLGVMDDEESDDEDEFGAFLGALDDEEDEGDDEGSEDEDEFGAFLGALDDEEDEGGEDEFGAFFSALDDEEDEGDDEGGEDEFGAFLGALDDEEDEDDEDFGLFDDA